MVCYAVDCALAILKIKTGISHKTFIAFLLCLVLQHLVFSVSQRWRWWHVLPSFSFSCCHPWVKRFPALMLLVTLDSSAKMKDTAPDSWTWKINWITSSSTIQKQSTVTNWFENWRTEFVTKLRGVFAVSRTWRWSMGMQWTTLRTYPSLWDFRSRPVLGHILILYVEPAWFIVSSC